MDIGTAKPSHEEQEGVPHWGINLVDPGQVFSAADFKVYAEQKINEIRNRGKIPFLVGGTGLYVDGVVLDYSFGLSDTSERQLYKHMTLAELHKYCEDNNIALPENSQNNRYVINTIVRNGSILKMNNKPRSDAIVVGIATDRDELRNRISQRAVEMFRRDIVKETESLASKFGWDNEAMTANIYRYIYKYICGELSLDQAREEFTFSDWHLAKRQLTWFRRRSFVQWMELNDAYTKLAQVLANLNNS